MCAFWPCLWALFVSRVNEMSDPITQSETPLPAATAGGDVAADALAAMDQMVSQAADLDAGLEDELAGSFESIETVRAEVEAAVGAEGEVQKEFESVEATVETVESVQAVQVEVETPVDSQADAQDSDALKSSSEAAEPEAKFEPGAAIDLDALLAQEADTVLEGGFETTHPNPDEAEAVHDATATAPATSEEEKEALINDAFAAAKLVVESEDAGVETKTKTKSELEANASEVVSVEDVSGGDATPDASVLSDADAEAEAFAAAFLAEEMPESPSAPEVEAAAELEEGPAAPNAERVSEAIRQVEALLAEADQATEDAKSPTADQDSASGGAEGDSASDADGDVESESKSGTKSDEEAEAELMAGLFAAPSLDIPSAAPVTENASEGEAGGLASDSESVAAPPIHPDTQAGSDVEDEAVAASGLKRSLMWPLGLLGWLLTLVNRPLLGMSDQVRLTVGAVALAVAVPGGLLLGYALLLK